MEDRVGELNGDVMSHHLCPALGGESSFKSYGECVQEVTSSFNLSLLQETGSLQTSCMTESQFDTCASERVKEIGKGDTKGVLNICSEL